MTASKGRLRTKVGSLDSTDWRPSKTPYYSSWESVDKNRSTSGRGSRLKPRSTENI